MKFLKAHSEIRTHDLFLTKEMRYPCAMWALFFVSKSPIFGLSEFQLTTIIKYLIPKFVAHLFGVFQTMTASAKQNALVQLFFQHAPLARRHVEIDFLFVGIEMVKIEPRRMPAPTTSFALAAFGGNARQLEPKPRDFVGAITANAAFDMVFAATNHASQNLGNLNCARVMLAKRRTFQAVFAIPYVAFFALNDDNYRKPLSATETFGHQKKCRGTDSNRRREDPADLQSAAINRSATSAKNYQRP